MANKQRYMQEIITGVFMVAILCVLGFFTIVISGADWLHGKKYATVHVAFENVGALKVQDPIMVRGLKIGSVSALRLKEDYIEATLKVPHDITIRSDYTITVGSLSVLGGSKLELDVGQEGDIIPHDMLLKGTPPHDVMADLGAVVAEVRAAIGDNILKDTMGNIKTATADIASITQRLEKGEGTLGKLLAADNSLYEDLQSTISNLRTTTDRLVQGEGFLGKLLDPKDATYEDFRATMANLRTVTDGIAQGDGLLGQLLTAEDESYEDLRVALANIRSITAKLDNPKTGLGRLMSEDTTLITDLEATAANLRQTTDKLNSGEGTLGRLVNDDTIANEAEAALKDVRQIIDNLRDTAPITTFSSLFFSGM